MAKRQELPDIDDDDFDLDDSPSAPPPATVEDTDEDDDDWGTADGGWEALDTGPDLSRGYGAGDTSIPLWEGYSRLRGSGDSYMLRIWKRGVEGTLYEMGTAEPDATIDAVIGLMVHHHLRAGQTAADAVGRYEIMPCSRDGKQMAAESFVIRVPATHPLISEHASTPGGVNKMHQAAANAGSSADGTPGAEFWQWLKDREAAAAADYAKRQESIDEEMREARRVMEAASQDRVAMALSAQEEAGRLYEKILERSIQSEQRLREREQAVSESQVKAQEAMFSSQLEANNKMWESLSRLQGDNFKLTQQIMQESAERQRQADRELAQERERLALEREKMLLQQQTTQLEFIRSEQARQTKWTEQTTNLKMMEMQAAMQAQNPLSGISKIGELKEVLGSVKDLLGDDGDEKKGVLSEVMDFAKEAFKAWQVTQAMRGGMAGGMAGAMPTAPPQQAQQQAQPQQRQALPQYPDPEEEGIFWPGGQPQHAGIQAGGPAAFHADSQSAPAQQPRSDGSELGGVPPEHRAKARRIILGGVDMIRSTPEDQWSATIAGVVQADPATLIPYLQQVGVKDALVEAGLEADKADKIVEGLRAGGLEQHVRLV